MTGRLIVVVGGQFGSEGKGACAGHLGRGLGSNDLVIRTGGPNAGHTVYDDQKCQYKLRQLPTAAVTNPRVPVAIAAGGLIDLEVLDEELEQIGKYRAEQNGLLTVLIDPAATILEPRHAESERQDPALQWGSTCKGIGAARMDRLHRTARTWGMSRRRFGHGVAMAKNVDLIAREVLGHGGTVLVEAAQGYGLGLHTEYYPKTTSADCRAIDALADVGISPWEFEGLNLDVWLVVRPHPIRVAGDSGPLEGETSWEQLGLPPEHTTVTNKVRRVGQWDSRLVYQAIEANGGARVKVWLSMVDQVVPGVVGMTDWKQVLELPSEQLQELSEWARRIRKFGASVLAIGTGPDTAVVLPGAWL